jgi:hypothetical protein
MDDPMSTNRRHDLFGAINAAFGAFCVFENDLIPGLALMRIGGGKRSFRTNIAIVALR